MGHTELASGKVETEDQDLEAMLAHLDGETEGPTDDPDGCPNCRRDPSDRAVKREIVDRGTRKHAGKQTGWRRAYRTRRVCPDCGRVYDE